MRVVIVVLEIGCYSGYSALAWAEALKDVQGAEVDPAMDRVDDR